MICYLHESNHAREGPSIPQEQTSTTELHAPTCFTGRRPLEGQPLLSSAFFRMRGTAHGHLVSPLYLEIQEYCDIF